ncbi:hypothetical protein [Pseudomonas tohonis]|uniref:hypothetical protein n=1 Tax=Pseudomonas tohonis TaxID=2725477 RepID=UPI001F465E94|nr:hypothetical protein [Pseudomonas tohonis]
MKVLFDLLNRKEKAQVKRATTVDPAAEIEGLADLLENVLKETSANGKSGLRVAAWT